MCKNDTVCECEVVVNSGHEKALMSVSIRHYLLPVSWLFLWRVTSVFPLFAFALITNALYSAECMWHTILQTGSTMSVCPPAWNNSSSSGGIFMKFGIWLFFLLFSEKIQTLSKCDKNNGYFTWRPIHMSLIMWLNLVFGCFFLQSSEKIQTLSKCDKNNGYFTWRPIHMFLIMWLNLVFGCFFLQSSEKIQTLSQCDKNNGYYTWRPIHMSLIIWLNLVFGCFFLLFS